MYIQEVSIEIKTDINKNDVIDEFWLLMNCYRANGQKQGGIESQYITGNTVIALPSTLEKDSLDPKYNNIHISEQIQILEELCNSQIQFRLVGEDYEDHHTVCDCHTSEFYILMTNYTTIESPINCGTCYWSVPLYRLPKYWDDEYLKILSWETDYICCDRLQMNCWVWNYWGVNQMQKVDSYLSKQGIEICKRIEELTSIPTYYFLYNYRKAKGDQLSRPCPTCGNKWDLKEQLHNFYDFKCDTCRLVSTISPNT